MRIYNIYFVQCEINNNLPCSTHHTNVEITLHGFIISQQLIGMLETFRMS